MSQLSLPLGRVSWGNDANDRHLSQLGNGLPLAKESGNSLSRSAGALVDSDP